MGQTRPSPCFLDQQLTCGAPGGRKRWRSARGDRFFEWDELHGHIECYNKRGKHIAVLDAITGDMIGDAIPGRRIDV